MRTQWLVGKRGAVGIDGWRERMADFALAVFSGGVVAAVSSPHANGDVHLEFLGIAGRAMAGVISSRIVTASVRLELFEMGKDVKCHGTPAPRPR